MSQSKLSRALSHIAPELIEEAALSPAEPRGGFGHILRIGIPAAAYAALLAAITLGALHLSKPLPNDYPGEELSPPAASPSDSLPSFVETDPDGLPSGLIWGNAGAKLPSSSPEEDAPVIPSPETGTVETGAIPRDPDLPVGYHLHESQLRMTAELIAKLKQSNNLTAQYAVLVSGGNNAYLDKFLGEDGNAVLDLQYKQAALTDHYYALLFLEKLSIVQNEPDYPRSEYEASLREVKSELGDINPYYDAKTDTFHMDAIADAMSGCKAQIALVEERIRSLQAEFRAQYGMTNTELFASLGIYVYDHEFRYLTPAYAPGPQILIIVTAPQLYSLAEILPEAGFSLEDFGFSLASRDIFYSTPSETPYPEDTEFETDVPEPPEYGEFETDVFETDVPEPDDTTPNTDADTEAPPLPENDYSWADVLAGNIPSGSYYEWNGLRVDYLLYRFLTDGFQKDPYLEAPPVPAAYRILFSHGYDLISLPTFTHNGFTYDDLIARIDRAEAELNTVSALYEVGAVEEAVFRAANDAVKQANDALTAFKKAYEEEGYSAATESLLHSLGYTVMERLPEGVILEVSADELAKLARDLANEGLDLSVYEILLLDYHG